MMRGWPDPIEVTLESQRTITPVPREGSLEREILGPLTWSPTHRAYPARLHAALDINDKNDVARHVRMRIPLVDLSLSIVHVRNEAILKPGNPLGRKTLAAVNVGWHASLMAMLESPPQALVVYPPTERYPYGSEESRPHAANHPLVESVHVLHTEDSIWITAPAPVAFGVPEVLLPPAVLAPSLARILGIPEKAWRDESYEGPRGIIRDDAERVARDFLGYEPDEELSRELGRVLAPLLPKYGPVHPYARVGYVIDEVDVILVLMPKWRFLEGLYGAWVRRVLGLAQAIVRHMERAGEAPRGEKLARLLAGARPYRGELAEPLPIVITISGVIDKEDPSPTDLARLVAMTLYPRGTRLRAIPPEAWLRPHPSPLPGVA